MYSRLLGFLIGWGGLAFVLLGAPIGAQAEVSDSARAHFNGALEAVKASKVDVAIAEYEKAIGFSPDYLDARNNVAELYFQKSNYAKAAEHMQAALKVDSANVQAWKTLGAIESKQAKHSAAAAAYQRASALAPKDNSIRASLAGALKSAGQDAQAFAEYRKVVEADPKDSKAWFQLGNIYSDQQKHEQAIEAFRKAIAANPSYINPYLSLAISTQMNGDYKGALAAYQDFVAKAKSKSTWTKKVQEAEQTIKQIKDYLAAQGNQ